MDVHHVQRQNAQGLLDRPRHVDGQRSGPAARRRERQHLPDAQDQRLPVGPLEQFLRVVMERAAAVPDQVARLRGRDDQDPVAPRRQRIRDPRDVLADLLRCLPGERGYLRDRQCT
jgi:hypothetical protein